MARGLGGLFLMGLASSCSTPPPEPPAETPPRTGYLADPVWVYTSAQMKLSDATPATLGAGPAIAAILVHQPCIRLLVVLHPTPRVWVGHPCDSQPDNHPLRNSARHLDVVWTPPGGSAWWLEPVRRTIVSEQTSGDLAVIARLSAEGSVNAACSVDGRKVVYTDAARPGVILLQDLERPDSASLLPLPGAFASLDTTTWKKSHLSGAPGQPCVLINPRVSEFLIVEDAGEVRAIAHHEPVPAEPPPASRWNVVRWLRPAPPPVAPGPLDAVSFAGGIAILYHGATAERGRLIDLYDRRGAYSRTMILPETVQRIASTGEDLLTLSKGEKGWQLTLYRFPMLSDSTRAPQRTPG